MNAHTTHADFFSTFGMHNWSFPITINNCHVAQSPCHKFIALMIPYMHNNTPLANICIITAEEYAEVMNAWLSHQVKHNGALAHSNPMHCVKRERIIQGFNDSSLGEVKNFLKRIEEDF